MKPFPDRHSKYCLLALQKRVLHVYQMVLITCGLTVSVLHLSIVETEIILLHFKKSFLKIDF